MPSQSRVRGLPEDVEIHMPMERVSQSMCDGRYYNPTCFGLRSIRRILPSLHGHSEILTTSVHDCHKVVGIDIGIAMIYTLQCCVWGVSVERLHPLINHALDVYKVLFFLGRRLKLYNAVVKG